MICEYCERKYEKSDIIKHVRFCTSRVKSPLYVKRKYFICGFVGVQERRIHFILPKREISEIDVDEIIRVPLGCVTNPFEITNEGSEYNSIVISDDEYSENEDVVYMR